MAETKKRQSISGQIEEVIMVRLHPDDDVLQAIWDTIVEYDIKAGCILDGSGCLETFKFQHFPENPSNSLFPEDVLTMHGPIEASIQGTIGMLDVDGADRTSGIWAENFPNIPGQFDTNIKKWHMTGSPEPKTGVPYVHAHCTCTNAYRTMCGHLMPGSKVQSLYQENDVPSHFTLLLAKFKDMKLVMKYDKDQCYHELVKL